MSDSPREVTCRYLDPLDLIWLATARALGICVERSAEVFASWDGAGTLTLGSAETLDADDSLAQLIFHEICHALVEGPEAFAQVDWGLCNTDARDAVREHACIRLQAALAGRHGLRELLAVTTDFRAYGDALGDDPLGDDPLGDDPLGDDPLGDDPLGDDPLGDDPLGDDPLGDDPLGDDPLGDDPALGPAREGWIRATSGPWAGPLDEALRVTAAIARLVAPHASDAELWSRWTDPSSRESNPSSRWVVSWRPPGASG